MTCGHANGVISEVSGRALSPKSLPHPPAYNAWNSLNSNKAAYGLNFVPPLTPQIHMLKSQPSV